jgi:ribosomal protein S18 acetylase RimI-like enzyme
MINIIKAGPKDLPAIRDLAEKIWPFAYGEILSVDQLEYMLDKFYSVHSLAAQINIMHHEFFIAELNEEFIGFISIGKSEKDPSKFILHKIYVLPKFQGKKIGQALLDFAIAKTKTAGGKSLQLNVNRKNQAIHFYKKNGFKIIREEDIDIGNGYYMNDYRMQLKVSC